MKSADKGPGRIAHYCETLPSPSTRYVTYRELLNANRFRRLSLWDERLALTWLRSFEGKLQASTIQVRGRRLHSYFAWELRQGLRKGANPIDLKSLPKCRDTRAPAALTREETQRLLKKIPSATWIGARDKLAVALMLVNGYRIGTIAALNWTDIEKRGDGYHISTIGKGGIRTSRKLRDDLVEVVDRYHGKTFGASFES